MLTFIVVVVQVLSKLLLKRIEVFECIVLVKFIFARSMESFNLAILRWFAWINEIVRDTKHAAVEVKGMYSRIRRISALFIASVV